MAKNLNKNKPSRRLKDTGKVVKKSISNKDRPERNEFPIFRKIKKNGQDTLYVRIPVVTDQDPNDRFLWAAAAEFHRALAPKDGAPKTRVEVDDQNIPVATLSKYHGNFKPVNKQFNLADVLSNPTYKKHLAQGLAMMYLCEGFDLNPGNLDLEHGLRIDFEYDFVDYFYSDIKNIESYFNSQCISPPFFNIHPHDIHSFPNFVVAKPQSVLYICKANREHNYSLSQLNKDAEFTKTVHQYFLKALLFDQASIKEILKLHIPEEKSEEINKFSDHIQNRFNILKYALFQEPVFIDNFKNHYDEYKTEIIAEFSAYYGEEFDSKPIEEKLTELFLIARSFTKINSYQDKFNTAFQISFSVKDDFHLFAMKMLLVSQDQDFNIEKLLKLIKQQADSMSLLHDAADVVHKNANDYWEQAKSLYLDDRAKSEDLKRIQNENDKPYDTLSKTKQTLKKLSDALSKIHTNIHYTPESLDPSVLFLQQEYLLYLFSPPSKLEEINKFFEDSFEYAETLNKEGHKPEAIDYLESISKVAVVLQNGLENNHEQSKIVKDMIEIINKSASLAKHRNMFEKFVRLILDLFTGKAEVSLSSSGVSTPLFSTRRQEKLCNLVGAVYRLDVLKP